MVSLSEVHDAAISLSEEERCELICNLIDTVTPDHHQVSDEAVQQRAAEWERGGVEGLSWEEVKRSLRRDQSIAPPTPDSK